MHMLLHLSAYNEGLHVRLRGFVFQYIQKDRFDLIKEDNAAQML